MCNVQLRLATLAEDFMMDDLEKKRVETRACGLK